MSSLSTNSDGSLPVHLECDPSWMNDNTYMKIEQAILNRQIKKECIDSNMLIDTYEGFQKEDTSGFKVVWKENYFQAVVPLREPRGPKYVCTECNEAFVTRQSILTHSMIHRKFFCVICLFYMETREDMNMHLTTFHAPLVRLENAKVERAIIFQYSGSVAPQSTDIKNEMPDVKSVFERRTVRRTRLTSLRNKNKIEPMEKPVEAEMPILKSRYGRSITVKKFKF